MNSLLLAGTAFFAAASPAASWAQDHHAHQPNPPATTAPASDQPEDHSGHAEQEPPASPHHGPSGDRQEHQGHGDTLSPQEHHDGHSPARRESSAEGSGTARVPLLDQGAHGFHASAAGWNLMLHGYAWGVYTDQGGPRGDDMPFVASMAMAHAQRDLGGASLQLRTMLSLDPLMGNRGYPILFAAGETAGGEPLVDRQHPHDFFMELAAKVEVPIGRNAHLFLYGGPVAEPALGPSAFMHRGSSRYNPEAPIGHHWFDSTHISFGVVTAGLRTDQFQIEGSAFRGREPDEERWDVETPRFDSWSVRGTWTPSPRWAAQLSFGRLESPERLHADEDEERLIASLSYVGGALAVTGAFASKNRLPGPTVNAWLLEANWQLQGGHNLFGRLEQTDQDELLDHHDPRHGNAYKVGRATLGYAYRMALRGPWRLALGGSASLHRVPDGLQQDYGETPFAFTLFAKISLGD